MADNPLPQGSNMKPSDGDRLLSFVLRKEFPKTTKLKARAFWKLARASELMLPHLPHTLKPKAFETLKLNKFLPFAHKKVDQNLAAAVKDGDCNHKATN
jgi:hypothetical protein